MIIVVAILVVTLIGVLLYNIKVKQDIKCISRQLEEIYGVETNRNITSLTLDKDICNLARNINKITEEQKRILLDYRRKDKEMKQIITNISHDLRTPLTSAIGYIQILQNEEIAPLKRLEYLEIVEQRVVALNKLINMFFEFSRLQSDEYEVEFDDVNISEVLCDTMALFYDDFVARNRIPTIKLSDEPVFLTCDQAMLERIFQNLIQNSLIHGCGETEVTLSTNEKFIEIKFSNAISKEIDTERLFERFYTADESRSHGTTGLGLAVVKRMVEKNNGSIVVRQQDKKISFVMKF